MLLEILFLYYYIVNLTSAWVQFHTIVTEPPTEGVQEHQEVLKKMCLLRPERGPCRANVNRYYFSPRQTNCSLFTYGGCQGNGNRFHTYDECMGSCYSTKPKSYRPRYCKLTFDYGYCFGGETRYYYDKLYKVCKETIYSGCGGNKNNFYSKEQCDQICRFGNRPTRPTANGGDVLHAKKILIVNPHHATTKPEILVTTHDPIWGPTDSRAPPNGDTTAGATSEATKGPDSSTKNGGGDTPAPGPAPAPAADST